MSEIELPYNMELEFLLWDILEDGLAMNPPEMPVYYPNYCDHVTDWGRRLSLCMYLLRTRPCRP